MRLTADELTKLKEEKRTKVWRRGEQPDFAEVGRKYTTAGEVYTVKDVKCLGRGALFRHFPEVYESLQLGEAEEVWMVSVVLGDHTDPPRLMHWTGKGGDERGYGDMFLGSKKVMPDAEALSDADLDKFITRGREDRGSQLARRGLARTVKSKRFVAHKRRLKK